MSDKTFAYDVAALWMQDNTRIADIRSFTPPALAVTVGNFKTTWYDMAIPVDTGLEPMQSEFKAGCDVDILAMFGMIQGGKSRVQVRRVYTDSDQTVHTWIDEMEGVISNITADEHGTDSKEGVGVTVTMNLSYYKLTVDDSVRIEIDPANMIRSVNGVNQLAALKDALLM